MKFVTITKKEVFERIKDGDSLGYYRGSWWAIFAWFISVITGGKISHVSKIYEVNKEDPNAVTFKLAEFTYHKGAVYKNSKISKETLYGRDFYFMDYFNYSIIYYLELKIPLTQEGVRRGIRDILSQEGTKHYGIKTLLRTLSWVNRIFPKNSFLNPIMDYNKITKVCSTFCFINDWKNGSLNKDRLDKQVFITPRGYAESDHLTLYKIAD